MGEPLCSKVKDEQDEKFSLGGFLVGFGLHTNTKRQDVKTGNPQRSVYSTVCFIL